MILNINDSQSRSRDLLKQPATASVLPTRYLVGAGFLQYHPYVLDAWVRRYSGAALAQFDQSGPLLATVDVPALLAGLKDDNWRVRSHSADAFGRMGSAATAHLPALITALKDSYSSVRYSAASALGRIGPSASVAIPALVAALKDNDSLVRMRVADALGTIARPVIWQGKQRTLGPADLQSFFEKPSAALLIEGEAGSGKTTQALHLARWALATNAADRLCRKHPMLPILFSSDPFSPGKGGTDALIAAIQGRLQLLTGPADAPSAEMVFHLLRTQRILVIVDDLSEMSAKTRELFLSPNSDLPLNALIVTSRNREPLQHKNSATICMCEDE